MQLRNRSVAIAGSLVMLGYLLFTSFDSPTRASMLIPAIPAAPFLEDSEPEPSNPEHIEQQRPAFYVRAWVNHEDRVYQDGDELWLKVTSERDAYLYVLYRQVDGTIYQIYPNSIHPDNRVKAKETIELGTPDDLFRWRVVAPFGKESLTVIASKNPIDEMSRKEQIARQFNPVSNEQLQGVEDEIENAEASSWVSAHVSLVTKKREVTEPPEPKQRRIGLFVGVSKHMFSEEQKAALNGESDDVVGPDTGARELSRLMKSFGKLDIARVLVNEDATRAEIEEAITRWLTSNSQPGDEVFIYFSGHTGQIVDDNHDEKDGKDELMICHDTLSLIELGQLATANKEGRLSKQKEPYLYEALAAVAASKLVDVPEARGLPAWQQGGMMISKAADADDEKMLMRMNDVILRHSGISDDIMGQWLLRLDGRKVVIILDTCHSGGHSNIEKSFGPHVPAALDFLDGETARLKDIGQRNLALLASSSVLQLSIAINRQIKIGDKELLPIGLFSNAVVDAINSLESPASVSDVFQHAEAWMQEIMQSGFPDSQQTPFLFNDLSETVLIKP